MAQIKQKLQASNYSINGTCYGPGKQIDTLRLHTKKTNSAFLSLPAKPTKFGIACNTSKIIFTTPAYRPSGPLWADPKVHKANKKTLQFW